MNIKKTKKFWKNRKVFITGHTGFKGSWLCIFLNLLGAKITGYSLRPNTNPSLFEKANIKKICEKSIINDIRDFKNLKSAIKNSKAEIVFHLAAQPLVRYSYLNPKETFDTNFTGTLNILECIRENNKIKSSIIVTTDKVYDNEKNKIFNENDKLGGYDPYSASKVCSEFLFSSYIKSYFKNNQRLATVRAGNVIGGGDYSSDRLIPDIFRFHSKKRNIKLRNPKSIRPWQHVLEPVSGYIFLAENIFQKKLDKYSPNWNFAPNISSCKSVKYVANYFANALNLKIIIKKNSNKEFKPETSFLRLSNFKSRKYLKITPRWPLNLSLEKILEWNKKIKKENCRKVCEDQIKDFLS